MADHLGVGELVLLQHRQAAHEVLDPAGPNGFQTEILAHQHLVRVAGEGPDVHEMTHGHVGASLSEAVEALGDGRQGSGALEDHVGALASLRVLEDERLARIRISDVIDVDGDVGADPARQVEAARGPPDNDHPARATELGADEGHEADRSCTLDDHGVTELHPGPQDAVDPDGEGFGHNGHFRRELGLEDDRVRIPEVDVVGKAPAQVGLLLGLEEPVGPLRRAGDQDHPVSFGQGTAQVVGLDAFTQGLNGPHVLVAVDHLALETLVLPVVEVGAADAGELLFQEHRAGRRVGDRVLPDLEALTHGDDCT